MIFWIKVRKLDEESDEFDVVKVFYKDNSIEGVWAVPEEDEMHVYVPSGELVVEYDEEKYNRIVELTGNNLNNIGHGIS